MMVSSDLFNRSEDNNWDTIYEICCGLKPIEVFPEEHQYVLDELNQLNDKQFKKYLCKYFSLAIDSYKTREESVVKVLFFISSVLESDIRFNDKQIIELLKTNSKVSLKTKVSIFNFIFNLLAKNFKHLSLNQTFDLNLFIEKLLESNELNDELLVNCFDLILQIDYQLIAKNDNILKQILIRCNPSEDESQELVSTKTQFFITLFEVYFKAKKAVKLHEILSEISIDLNQNLLDFNLHLIQLYGKSILELPFGQSVDLWKLFLNTFNINNKFLTKLFANFLLHIRCLDDWIPNQFKTQIKNYLNDTKELLKSTTNTLVSDNEELVQNLLELYIAFQSLIDLQMTYNQNYLSLENCDQLLVTNDWFDLSIIYDFTEKTFWKSLFENIDNLSPTLRQLLVKSLLQKFNFWKVCELNLDLSDDKKIVVKTSINQLLSGLIINFSNKLNAFSLQQINAIIRHLNRNDLSLLSDSIIINALELDSSEDNLIGFDVKQLLTNGSVWENIDFQTAFVSSFVKQIALRFTANKKRKLNEEIKTIESIYESLVSNSSVWFKYATLSPDFKKLNKMWSYIANASKQTEQLIQSDDQINKKVKIPVNLIEMFVECVPLEYLLPANQIRCLLSLSLLLFCIDFTEDKNSLLVNLILDSILYIFDGVRSVWFFNFINPSNYLIKVLKVLNNYKNHEKLRLLFTKLMENLWRNTDQIEELKNKLVENEDKISFELLIIIETILLKRSLHVLNLKSVPKNMIKLKEFCGPLSHELSNTVHNRIKKHLMSETNIESLNSILIIDSFAAVFEFQVSKSASDEEIINLKTKWRKLLAKLIDISVNQLMNKSTNDSCVKFLVLLCVNRKKLTNILPQNFVINLWHVLCPKTGDNEEVVEIENALKDNKLIDVWNQRENFNFFFNKIQSNEEQNINRFLESISAQNSFTEVIKPLIIALIKYNSVEEFEQIIETLITHLESNDNLIISYSLSLLNAVFESDFHLNADKNHLFQKHINQLLTLCANHCQQCNQNDRRLTPEIQFNIKVEILKTCRSVIHITKNVITSPQLFLTIHTCIDAKLDHYVTEPQLFIVLYEGIYAILNEALLQHKYICIASMSSFNLIVEHLLKSLMNVSNEQQFISYEPIIRHDLEICSKNMDRLLTLMASLATDYSSFAPHLVASYVIQSECVSVHIIVKKNIMSGINRLFKLLSETNAMEMVFSRMNESSRKIFRILFDNFDKYYKFKGQI